MLVAVGPSHLFEDGVPAFGRDGLDGGKAPEEGALRALTRYLDEQELR